MSQRELTQREFAGFSYLLTSTGVRALVDLNNSNLKYLLFLQLRWAKGECTGTLCFMTLESQVLLVQSYFLPESNLINHQTPQKNNSYPLPSILYFLLTPLQPF